MLPAARIVVSGFEPFGSRERNGSLEFARAIHGQFPATTLLEAPVVWDQVGKMVGAQLASRPSLWLAFGEAPGSSFRIETRARNRRHIRPDSHGRVPPRDLIDPAGPKELRALFPAASLARKLRRKGYPCRVSTNAGAYLCEELYYNLLRAREHHPETEVIFVHVPHLGVDITVNGVGRPFRDELLQLAAWDFFTVIGEALIGKESPYIGNTEPESS